MVIVYKFLQCIEQHTRLPTHYLDYIMECTLVCRWPQNNEMVLIKCVNVYTVVTCIAYIRSLYCLALLVCIVWWVHKEGNMYVMVLTAFGSRCPDRYAVGLSSDCSSSFSSKVDTNFNSLFTTSLTF